MYQAKVDTRHLPPDLQELVDTIITGVMALASRTDSNGGSNPPGVVLIPSGGKEMEMAELKPRRKAPKREQLAGELKGELGAYQKFGLLQRALGKRSVYRYRGCLLQYQKALNGQPPTLQASKQFLAHLRGQGFDPNTIKVYRAALKGFHAWRGEDLKFEVKIPHRQPKYIEPSIVEKVLQLAKGNPRDYLMLCLMSQAGLRRGEVVSLKVGEVGETAIRLTGKGGRERTIPMTDELARLIKQYCAGRHNAATVVGASRKAVYWAVKKYGRMAGMPELKPHDLRHAFAERMVEGGANLRAVQELLGHSSLATTEVYIGVTGNHLKEAIDLLDDRRQPPPEKGLMSWELPRYQSAADKARAAGK